MSPETQQDVLRRICEDTFPRAPELARYLRTGLLAHEGTPAVARAIVAVLTEAFGSLADVTVTDECVERLSDESNPNATHDIYLELVSYDPRFQPFGNALALSLRGVMRVRKGTGDVTEVVVLRHASLPRDHVLDYLRLFYRAYAMIAHLSFDPACRAA